MYERTCCPHGHTGASGSHRSSPASHSFHPSLVIRAPQQSPADQAVLTLFLSTVPAPFPHTQAPVPSVSRRICTWGATRRESRAAGLGHKLETCEHPWPLCGKGSRSLAAHPACPAATTHQPDLPWEEERITGEGGPFGGEGLPPLPPARTQEFHVCISRLHHLPRANGSLAGLL